MRVLLRFLILGIFLSPAAATAQERAIPALGEGTRPWLLFNAHAENSAENRLMAAWVVDGAVQTEELARAAYLAVKPLVAPHVLLSTGGSEAASQHYVVNLETGERVLVSERRGHDPVGFPRAGERFALHTPTSTAFLIQDAGGADDLEFVSVHYRDMKADHKKLDKSHFKTPFDDGVRLYIAPDGKHVAFLEAGTPPANTERVLRYRLKVYHFSNGSVNVVDDEVYVQYSKHAPVPFLWPAVGWSDNTHLVYTHSEPQAPGGPDQTLVKFRKVEVEQGGKEVLFDQVLPHPHASATLLRDRASNNLILRYPTARTEDFVVVAEAATLLPNPDATDGLLLKRGAGVAQVLRGDTIIFNQAHFGESLDGLISDSKLHTAFILSGPGETPEAAARTALFLSLNRGTALGVDLAGLQFAPLYWLE